MAENPSTTNPSDLASLARELFEMVEEYKLTAKEAAETFDKLWNERAADEAKRSRLLNTLRVIQERRAALSKATEGR
jgi:hypothetical protein